VQIVGIVINVIGMLILFLTLWEMIKQRQSSYKPDVYLENTTAYHLLYVEEINDFAWSRTNTLKKEELYKNDVFINVFNLGLGPAKCLKINIHTDITHFLSVFDKLNAKSVKVKILDDHFVHIDRDIPLITENMTYNIEENVLISSNNMQGIQIPLPRYYKELYSNIIYEFVNSPEKRQNKMNHELGTIPPLIADIKYTDIGKHNYSKRIKISVQSYVINGRKEKIDEGVWNLAQIYLSFKEM